ncbi:hypothetical protein BS47DRAFT_1303946, partial [Hydnum rufescens UP504]
SAFDSNTFVYNCAQAEGIQKKKVLNSNPELRWDRWCMDQFNCNGMLQLTIHDSHPDIVHLTLAHDVHHIPYCKISLTDMVKDLIRNRKNSVPQEIWKEIMQSEVGAEFTHAQVYSEWVRINQNSW